MRPGTAVGRFIHANIQGSTLHPHPISLRDSYRLRRTHRISWAPSGWFINFQVGAPATSFHVFSCSDDFYAVRLGFVNNNSNPYLVKQAIGTSSATISDFVNPAGAAPWTRFTCSNSSADDDYLIADNDAPAEIVVAGSRSVGGPQWTWTDWVPIASRRRIDKPDAPRLLFVRVLLSGNADITQPNGGFSGFLSDERLNDDFFYYGAGWVAGDFVSSPDIVLENTAPADFGVARATVACVQFLTRNRGLVGMTAGDSHHQGTSTTTQFLNYLLRSTLALGSQQVGAVPFGYVSTAVGGATSEQFFGTLLSLIPAIRPSFVMLPGWTFNDHSGRHHADERAVGTFTARLLMAAERCISDGILPIFLTPFPRDALSMTIHQIEPWRKLRQMILDMKRSGAVVLDATPILGESGGLFSGTYLSGLSTDGVHPNDAGHAAISDILTPLIARLAGSDSR